MAPDDDEPVFLRSPPPPLPEPVKRAIDEVVTAATPALVELAARAAARRWDDPPPPPGPWTALALGPHAIEVPPRWLAEPPDPRGWAWVADDRAMVSLSMLATTRRPVPIDVYVDARPELDDHGYLRIDRRDLAHPSGARAVELIEVHPADPRRPVRALRILEHPAMLAILKLDTDGWIDDDIGAEFAHAFATLRLAGGAATR